MENQTRRCSDHSPGQWTRIAPYGEDAYIWWISGIYKIVSYRKGEYHAFFIQDHCKNWGDHVATPRHQGENGKCWNSFTSAQDDCLKHAAAHAPAAKTVKRAAELLAVFMAEASEHAKGAVAA